MSNLPHLIEWTDEAFKWPTDFKIHSYGAVTVCVKCGSRLGKGSARFKGPCVAEYHEGRLCIRTGAQWVDITEKGGHIYPPHLHVRCTMCRYEWLEHPADAEKKDPGGGGTLHEEGTA